MRLAQVIWLMATVGAVVASAVMNYHYMAGEGTGLQGQIMAWVSVVLDLGKSVLPVLIAGAWAAGAWLRAVLGSVFLVLLVLFGLASALGFGEASKGGRVATREGAAAILASVDREIGDLETRRIGVTRHRSLREVEAALKVAWLSPVIEGQRLRGTLASVSRHCTAISSATADACGTVQRLVVEVAAAGEAERIEGRLAELRVEQRRLRAHGAGQDADPQASIIRRLIGRLIPDPDLASIRAGVVAILAVLIEGLSAFGLYLSGLHQVVGQGRGVATTGRGVMGAATSSDAIDLTPGAPALPAPPPVLSVAKWAVERMDFVAGGSVLLADAAADYRACAAAEGIGVLSEREFRRALVGAVLDLELEVYGQELRGVELNRKVELQTSAVL